MCTGEGQPIGREEQKRGRDEYMSKSSDEYK
jgi:hypothetical protein